MRKLWQIHEISGQRNVFIKWEHQIDEILTDFSAGAEETKIVDDETNLINNCVYQKLNGYSANENEKEYSENVKRTLQSLVPMSNSEKQNLIAFHLLIEIGNANWLLIILTCVWKQQN